MESSSMQLPCKDIVKKAGKRTVSHGRVCKRACGRRTDVAFDQLRQLIPTLTDRAISKVDIVNSATAHIENLHRQLVERLRVQTPMAPVDERAVPDGSRVPPANDLSRAQCRRASPSSLAFHTLDQFIQNFILNQSVVLACAHPLVTKRADATPLPGNALVHSPVDRSVPHQIC